MYNDTVPISELVGQLAKVRAETEIETSALAHWKEQLAKTSEAEQVARYEQAVTELREKASYLEGQLRTIAEQWYRDIGDTKWPGVQVKLFTKIKYDAAQALAWCKEHAPAFIIESVNAKAFEKAAPELDGAPVEVVKEPKVYIDKDLSQYA